MTNIKKEERRHWVGASESAALFGLSPFMTYFELWHRKAGNLPEPDLDSQNVYWGNVLESAVAFGIAEREGFKIRKVNRYYPHAEVEGMGASLDYEIVNHPDGPGVLEIKTVDSFAFRDWPVCPDGSIEPPIHYLIQLQHQLSCTGRKWGIIGALVGGNDCRIFRFDRHEKAIARIENAIVEFWRSIREGREPTPDFTLDADAIIAMSQAVEEGTTLDLSEDNYMVDLCGRYIELVQMVGKAEKEKKTIKAEIIEKIGAVETVIAGPYKVKSRIIPKKVINYTREASRRLQLTERKRDEE